MSCNPGYGTNLPLPFHNEMGEKFEMISPEMVREILPHRGNALRIDSAVCYAQSNRIVASRLLTESDYDFEGHFPGKPILPGVIQVEIAAQAAILLIKKKYPEMTELPYLTWIKETKFMRPALPGDVLSVSVSVRTKKGDSLHKHPFKFFFVITKKSAGEEKKVSSGYFDGKAARN